MKILHTISSISHNSGGPSQSVSMLMKGLWKKGENVELLSFDCEPGDSNVISNQATHFVPLPRDRRFLFSKAYKKALSEIKDVALYHVQGVWQYPNYIAAKTARKNGVPYLVTPRGMLYPQAINGNKTLLKKAMLKLHLMGDLNRAACVQATCVEEMNYLRDLGVKSAIAVIPNPVDYTLFEKHEPQELTFRRIGYLGRIHPRKKVEVLLHAWAKIQQESAGGELVIIGDGDKEYLNFLKAEAARLKLSNVKFTGFLKGDQKITELQQLSYLAVPSDFENFGMIIAEALSLGIPVITSKGTPWQELETHDCGWWIDNDVDSFTKAFQTAMKLDETQRLQMGQNGRRLIKNQYDIPQIANRMDETYHWILSAGTRPDFIFLQ